MVLKVSRGFALSPPKRCAERVDILRTEAADWGLAATILPALGQLDFSRDFSHSQTLIRCLNLCALKFIGGRASSSRSRI
jgi:hypothetical protein